MLQAPSALSAVEIVSNGPLTCVQGELLPGGREIWICADRGNLLYVYCRNDSSAGFHKVKSFQAHDDHIVGIVYVEGRHLIATGSADHTVKLWLVDDLMSPEHCCHVKARRYRVAVTFVAATDNGDVLFGSADGICHLSAPQVVLRHEYSAIMCACDIPDGFVTAGSDNTLRTWSPDGTLKQQVPLQLSIVACSFNRVRNKLVALAAGEGVQEWRASASELHILQTIQLGDPT
jgi:WD40 repeat protein